MCVGEILLKQWKVRNIRFFKQNRSLKIKVFILISQIQVTPLSLNSKKFLRINIASLKPNKQYERMSVFVGIIDRYK